MDGLESVTNIGQRASDNNAHGVVEVGALHFRLQVDLANTFDVADSPASTVCSSLTLVLRFVFY